MDWSGAAVMKCQKNLSQRPHKLMLRAFLFCRLCLPNGSVSLALSGPWFLLPRYFSVCVEMFALEAKSGEERIIVFSFAFR